MSRLRLALCQMNATVGDLAGNAERIRAGIDAGATAGAQVVLFPELALSGYPPEDLLLRAHFLEDTEAKLHELAGAAEGIVAIVGFPERGDGGVYNSAAVLAHGAVHTIYRKVHLPNYGVFDEQRYFKARRGRAARDRRLASAQSVGITVCEDLWVAGAPAASRGHRRRKPDREHIGVAVSRGQGPGARAAVRPARQRNRRPCRVLRHGRRPRRACLRRPLIRARPGEARRSRERVHSSRRICLFVTC